MTAPRILISGYYGFANAGDEAILHVIRTRLGEQCPEARISVVSGNPGETAAAYNVDAVLWSDPQAIAEAVRDSDLVIIGGGGLFHDYSGFIPDGLLTEGNWGLGFHVTPALLAALFSKPLMLYSVGVGPLFSEHGRRFTRAACEAASVITVRDAGSAALLAEVGVPAERIRVSADPAFLFEPAEPSRVNEILEQEGLNPQARRIGVVVRHWDFGVHPVFWQEQMAAGLDRLLDNAQALGIDEVLFIPFQRLPGEAEDDAAVSRRIHAAMRYSHTGESRILKSTLSPAELSAVLQSCRLVIGMRLHSLIFAACGQTPFVGIGYDPKVGHVMARADLEDTVLDIGALTAETLVSRVRDVLREWPGRSAKLAASLDCLRREALVDAQLAGELLQSGAGKGLSEDLIALVQTSILSQLKAYDRLRKSYDARVSELKERDSRIADLTAHMEAQDLLAEERLRALQKRAGRLVPLEVELRTALDRLEKSEAAATELQDRIADQNRQMDESSRESGSLRQELAAAEQTNRAATATLRHRDAWLIRNRNQRAWQVMLVIRKGYTLAFNRGWKGRLQFVMWLPGLLVGRTGDLSEFDLRFED